MNKTNIVSISVSYAVKYLENEVTENWSNFNNPLNWILDYTKRNHVENGISDEPVDEFVNGKVEPYLRLVFKSDKQYQIFLAKALILFPYLELY